MDCYKDCKQKKENQCLVTTDVSQLARAKEYIDERGEDENATQRVSHNRRIEHLCLLNKMKILNKNVFIFKTNSQSSNPY